MSDTARPAYSVRRRSWGSVAERLFPRERRTLWRIGVFAVIVSAATIGFPDFVPLTTLVLPMLFGSLFLGPRELPWFIVFLLVAVVITLTRKSDINLLTGGGVLVLFIAGFIILLTSFRRTRLGVGGSQGESMLIDLRDRIQGQGGVPALPEDWYAESALRSAGGTPFAGDFVVSARPHGGNRLDVALVDVSGKGEAAGIRALLLSGALGGLIGAMPPAEFLTAANDYLLRQDWDEGFATAVHLSLDLRTGEFDLRTAGHPPAAQRVAGSGRWSAHASEGPALGLLDVAEFPSVHGTLRPGDALLLFTDGMVESRYREIGLGIDRMLGQAERLLRGRFDNGARLLIDSLGSPTDDRALVLIHRR
ncbi:MAG: PP2C family protein-serine/threonine phosphatase [Nocardioides sp.]